MKSFASIFVILVGSLVHVHATNHTSQNNAVVQSFGQTVCYQQNVSVDALGNLNDNSSFVDISNLLENLFVNYIGPVYSQSLAVAAGANHKAIGAIISSDADYINFYDLLLTLGFGNPYPLSESLDFCRSLTIAYDIANQISSHNVEAVYKYLVDAINEFHEHLPGVLEQFSGDFNDNLASLNGTEPHAMSVLYKAFTSI